MGEIKYANGPGKYVLYDPFRENGLFCTYLFSKVDKNKEFVPMEYSGNQNRNGSINMKHFLKAI